MKTLVTLLVLLVLFVYFFIIRKNKRQRVSDFDQMWFVQSAGPEILTIIIDCLRINPKSQVGIKSPIKEYVPARKNEEAHWLFGVPLTHQNSVLHGKLYSSKKMLLSYNGDQKEIEQFSQKSLRKALHEIIENNSCSEQKLV